MDITQIEQSLIGALIDRPEIYPKIISIVQKQDFASVKHRKIFGVIEQLAAEDMPWDLVSICSELHNRQILEEIGGRTYLMGCMQGYGSESSAPFWAHKIVENSTREKARMMSARLTAELTEASNVNIQERLTDYISRLTELQSRTAENQLMTLSEIYETTAKELEELNAGKMKGVMTGFEPIDNSVGGFYPGEIIYIAGDSGVGKTNLTNQFIDNIAIVEKIPTLIIPLEMRQTALYKRFVLGRTDSIRAYAMRTGRLSDAEWTEFARVSSILAGGSIVMPKKHDLKFQDIQGLVYAAKQEFNIKVLVIDYFQLINIGSTMSETQAQTYLSRALKIMLLKYGLVGIILSQFRKRAPGVKGLRTMDDMRGSGAIGADADFIFYVHRDKIEGTNKYEPNGFIEMPKGREAETELWDVYYKHPRFHPGTLREE